MMTVDRASTALVVVDVQDDFCPGGALAVTEGDAVIDPINAISGSFEHVVLTQDWHPRGHLSFASRWPGKQPQESIEFKGSTQTLWPDHCVAESSGAEFHPRLNTARASIILRKGRNADLDSYSALYENDRRTPTGLDGWLRNKGIGTIILVGLATDYCVLYTGLDALDRGFAVVLLTDAIRGVDLPDGSIARALERLSASGAKFAASGELAVS